MGCNWLWCIDLIDSFTSDTFEEKSLREGPVFAFFNELVKQMGLFVDLINLNQIGRRPGVLLEQKNDCE